MSGLEFGSSSVELNSARTRVNVPEAGITLALRARRNTQLLAQALSVITAENELSGAELFTLLAMLMNW